MEQEVVDANEVAATGKAALWSAIAGAAHVLVVAIGALAYPYLFDVLIALAYGFMLPAIAVLHVRHAAVRQSGAILATIAGAAVATVGLSGSANVDVRPAALFVLGIWWWTIGKMWVQTGVMPRLFGQITALLGLAAFVLVPVEAFSNVIGTTQPWFGAAHVVQGFWLLVLSMLFGRERTRTAAG
ncbi:MAG: hypothetical protein ABI888_00810 [Chloroflexota bacterium]